MSVVVCPSILLARGKFTDVLQKKKRYFCNPNAESFIETLPGTYASEQDKKYEGVNSGEYLVKRLTATY